MSIVKEDNGTYTINYSTIDVITGNKKRTKKRGFHTLKEAKEFERSLNRESSSVLFINLFEESQSVREQEATTLEDKRSLIKNYLPTLLTIRYEALTKPFLMQLRSQINSFTLSARSKNKLVSIIKTTCKYANDIYDLEDNSKVLQRFKQTKTEMNIWSPQEFKKFEDVIKVSHPKYYPFFHLLFYTGMRRGEAKSLRVTDLNNDVISITKSMRRSRISEKAPKTNAGKRKIKIDTFTLELLTPLKSNETYLFGDYKPFNNNSIAKVWAYGIKESGNKPIRIHDLRHSHASYLLGNGANIVAVSKRLGHASINETLKTYAHLVDSAEEQIIKIVENCSQLVATD